MDLVQQKQQNDGKGNAFSKYRTFVSRGLALSIVLCLMLLLPGNACAGSFRLTPVFQQVLPMGDGAVAVLYTDGTVRVAGNNRISRVAANWREICQLYYQNRSPFGDGPMLAGLTENGSVVTTEGDLPEWKNVEKLRFCYRGIVGITKNGSVMICGEWDDPSILTSLTNVEDYGVAAMALGKGAYAIHQSGKWYTNENIDQMLMERHLNKKARRSSHKNHIKGARKRTEDDDVRFAQSFEKLILMAKSKEGA